MYVFVLTYQLGVITLIVILQTMIRAKLINCLLQQFGSTNSAKTFHYQVLSQDLSNSVDRNVLHNIITNKS